MQHKPILFLDFDRTLFDTEMFYAWIGEDRFSRVLDLSAGGITAPDFSAMIYPDVVDFLQKVKKTHRLVLLTYSVNTVLQRRKIRGSGLVPFFDDIIMTQKGKGVEARDYLVRMGDSGWEHTFVDDAPENISDMKTVNPEIQSIRIERVALSPEECKRIRVEADIVVPSLEALYPLLFARDR